MASRLSVPLRGVICVVAGHRWRQPPDSDEAYPVLECRRCRRRKELAPGTTTPFGARVDAQTGKDRAVGPFGRR